MKRTRNKLRVNVDASARRKHNRSERESIGVIEMCTIRE